jgi:XRE family aerobic/anaerobic benzoate catabolism transcriptional regulator
MTTRANTAVPQKAPNGAQEYTQHIADRVRGMRAQRGASRRLLARHARISERYLAQVEQGQANISIALLWQIAQALGTDPVTLLSKQRENDSTATLLAEFVETLSETQRRAALRLLRERFAAAPDSRHGVALVGLRGAGKSTLGGLLAQRTALPFVQLTDIIERIGNMAVDEIFSLGGQQTYRRLEKQAVEHVRDNYAGVILETGGSLVSAGDSYSTLRRHFFTVWVKAQPEEHMQRVVAQGDLRPIDGNDAAMDDLRRILQEREASYRAADYVLNTSERRPEDCIEELIAVLPQSSAVKEDPHP